jgi:hypothetical protein
LTAHQEGVTLRIETPDPKTAAQLIRDAVKMGEIGLSRHAREQMKARSFDLNDLLLVLSNGEISDTP